MKNSSNKLYYLAIAGIVLIVIFMLGATYAYFSLNIIGTGNQNVVNSIDEVIINFNDTSNVSLVNGYTGESITKTFNVVNNDTNAIYYDIKLTSLVNNFANPDDLVFTLTGTNGGAIVSETTVPTVTDTKLASYIKLAPSTTHTYTLVVTFKKTDEDQSANMNKTFSGKVAIDASSDILAGGRIYKTNSLGYAITNTTAISESQIDYNSVSDEDGLYYTNSSIDGAKIYFYRGTNELNNNVLFGGFCWKIIRTTSDLGIRLIYNGEPSSNQCTNTTQASTMISSSKYNTNHTYNAHVGYMYGTASSADYSSEHLNTNNSLAKTALKNWYEANLETYEPYLSDSYYCNNRKTASFKLSSVQYGKLGYSNNNTGYISGLNNLINNKPSYNCMQKDDIFTVSNARGNEKLDHPIGLITADEARFAGLTNSNTSTTNYLYNAADYWTMTPAYYNGSTAYNFIVDTNKIGVSAVDVQAGLRPVVTLNQNTVLLSGTGSNTNPYVITE